MKRLLRGWRLNSFFTATKAYSWAMGQEYLRPKTTKPAKYKHNMRCISSKQHAGVLHRWHLTPNIVSAPQFQGLDIAHAIFGLEDMGEGFVHISRGISGNGDLSVTDFDWRNPVAKVSVRRVRSGN